MASAKVVTGVNGKGRPREAPSAASPTPSARPSPGGRPTGRRPTGRRGWWPPSRRERRSGHGGGPAPAAAAPSRPAAAVPPAPPARKLPSLESLKPPSAKSVGASVGKYAVKQAGKAIGKAAADRVGKAIEVIEVLEKVVAAASSEPAAKPDLTPSGPGGGQHGAGHGRPGVSRRPAADRRGRGRSRRRSPGHAGLGPQVRTGPTGRRRPRVKPPRADAAAPAEDAAVERRWKRRRRGRGSGDRGPRSSTEAAVSRARHRSPRSVDEPARSARPARPSTRD